MASTLVYFGVFAFAGGRAPFYVLLLAAGVLGFCRGSGSALVNSIIGEFLEPERRAVNIARCSAIMQGGSGLVAFVGGWIAAGNGGENWPYAHFLGFLSIPTMVIFAILMPKAPDRRAVPSGGPGEAGAHASAEPGAAGAQVPAEMGAAGAQVPAEMAVDKGFRGLGLSALPVKSFLIIALHAVFMMCVVAYTLYSSVYIIIEYELGTSADAGLVHSSYTLLAVFIGLSYMVWSRLLGKWIVPVGYALVILCFVLMLTVTSTIAGIWVAAILLGFGFNFINPYIGSQLMSLAPPKLIPLSMSLYFGFTNLSMFSAPYVLRFAGRFLGGGLVGSLRTSALVLPFLAVAAVFLFVVDKKGCAAAPRTRD